MLFVEFSIVGVILIVICLLEIKLQHQINMPRPAGRPPPPSTGIHFNPSTYDERLQLLPPNMRFASREDALLWTDKSLNLKFPDDPDWYIDFGHVHLSPHDVNLLGLTYQKLGNWAEYLFQHVFRPHAANADLGEKNKPLVEGTALDGTFVTPGFEGVWTKSGIIYGRPYEIKSSTVDGFTFSQDNIKAVVAYNGFFIMAATSLQDEGFHAFYKGYTYADLIEMGIPADGYNPSWDKVHRAKVLAANWLIYGEMPDDPTVARMQEIAIQVTLPGEAQEIIQVRVPLGGVFP